VSVLENQSAPTSLKIKGTTMNEAELYNVALKAATDASMKVSLRCLAVVGVVVAACTGMILVVDYGVRVINRRNREAAKQ
jgi:hypothetical protein